MYDRTWVWIDESWIAGTKEGAFPEGYLAGEKENVADLFDNCLSALFLAYGNQAFDTYSQIDFFYSCQEEDGRICAKYTIDTKQPLTTESNPLGLAPPLLPYVEYCLYHKIGNKKRLKDAVVSLERYYNWISTNFQRPNGFYAVPYEACRMGNVPRDGAVYTVDFNSMMAVFALYMSNIGDILNDKELSFRYKRIYFSLKTRINSLMWDTERHFYFDLDEDERQINNPHIGAYWTLLAEIPNDEYAEYLIAKLKDPAEFGTDNPFPCVPVSSKYYSPNGEGYKGGVVPFYLYVVVKGLLKYDSFVFARECAIRHMYFILDTLHPEGDKVGDVWEAYKAESEGPSICTDGSYENRKRNLAMLGLVTIALMIENIIGLDISLPRKTVDWLMPSLEAMGIEHLSLKRNTIAILSNKNSRGWEIRLESEKLYYFTIEILDENKKKKLPIPSGKCSMLIDKL